MKKCPYCAEEIQEEAVKCRYCGEFFEQSDLPRDDLPAATMLDEDKWFRQTDERVPSFSLGYAEYMTAGPGEAWLMRVGEDVVDMAIPAVLVCEGEEYTVTAIDSFAFYDCASLRSVAIPDSVKEIRQSAFQGCTGLLEVAIPDSVSDIGFGAFQGCTSLRKVTLPNSITGIEGCTFTECSSLERIAIPASVAFVENFAFTDCPSLTRVSVQGVATCMDEYAFDEGVKPVMAGQASMEPQVKSKKTGREPQLAQWGMWDPSLVCPNCRTEGGSYVRWITEKDGISGAKATAAVITGGWSVLATGLSGKKTNQRYHCIDCGYDWSS